jgi:DNA oxidative demethylase
LSRLPFDRPDAVLLGPGITLLPGRAGPAVLEAARAMLDRHPPHRMTTPGGKLMSVAMTNCGALGWVTDASGYRYAALDPATGLPWPAMPGPFRDLAGAAAAACGFPRFEPEACLINLYGPAARLSLHQDRDEQDFTQPIVSVSLGRSALFRIGGARRGDPTRSVTLDDGDVLVFGGPARLMFHGVDRLTGPAHEVLGDCRINLTFRRVRAGVSGIA